MRLNQYIWHKPSDELKCQILTLKRGLDSLVTVSRTPPTRRFPLVDNFTPRGAEDIQMDKRNPPPRPYRFPFAVVLHHIQVKSTPETETMFAGKSRISFAMLLAVGLLFVPILGEWLSCGTF